MNQSSEKIIFKCNAQKYEIPKNKIEKVLYGKQRKVDSTEVGSDIVFFDFFVGYIEICLKKNFFEKLFRIKKRIYKKYYSNYHYQVNSNNTLDNNGWIFWCFGLFKKRAVWNWCRVWTNFSAEVKKWREIKKK